MARRKRRRAGQDSDRGCGCQGELDIAVRLEQDGRGELVDPDSMEDEELPYVWNRQRQP